MQVIESGWNTFLRSIKYLNGIKLISIRFGVVSYFGIPLFPAILNYSHFSSQKLMSYSNKRKKSAQKANESTVDDRFQNLYFALILKCINQQWCTWHTFSLQPVVSSSTYIASNGLSVRCAYSYAWTIVGDYICSYSNAYRHIRARQNHGQRKNLYKILISKMPRMCAYGISSADIVYCSIIISIRYVLCVFAWDSNIRLAHATQTDYIQYGVSFSRSLPLSCSIFVVFNTSCYMWVLAGHTSHSREAKNTYFVCFSASTSCSAAFFAFDFSVSSLRRPCAAALLPLSFLLFSSSARNFLRVIKFSVYMWVTENVLNFVRVSYFIIIYMVHIVFIAWNWNLYNKT